MRVLLIGAMVIIAGCIFVGVLIWDKKMANDYYKIMKVMWDKTKTYKERAYVPIKRLEIIQECDMDYNRFSIVIGKLKSEGYVETDEDTVQFTDRGVVYYDFTILPKFTNK